MAEIVAENGMEERQARFEMFIGFLAFFSLINVLLIILDLADWLTRPLLIMDTLLNVLFFLDFLRNLRRAESRRKFFFRVGWLDLVSCIPAPFVLRFFRLARLSRASQLLRRMGYQGVVRQFLANRAESSLLGAAVLAIVLVLVCSAIIVPIESGAEGANILDGSEAIWWAFVTVTTVGYGDYFPVTDTGRFVAALLMTVGVGLFGVLTSYLSTNFLSHDRETGQDELETEVKALRAEIGALRALLEEQRERS